MFLDKWRKGTFIHIVQVEPHSNSGGQKASLAGTTDSLKVTGRAMTLTFRLQGLNSHSHVVTTGPWGMALFCWLLEASGPLGTCTMKKSHTAASGD